MQLLFLLHIFTFLVFSRMFLVMVNQVSCSATFYILSSSSATGSIPFAASEILMMISLIFLHVPDMDVVAHYNRYLLNSNSYNNLK